MNKPITETVNVFQTIERVGVIGAGTMGIAITQHFLMKGLHVVLLDISEATLLQGMEGLQVSLSEALSRGIITSKEQLLLLQSLTTTTGYRKLVDCQLVVEAVFEDFHIKQKVFEQIEAHVGPQCIIASNTSSFSISVLSSSLNNQERFIGIHYFYHAAKNKLVEVIPGAHSDEAQVQRLVSFYLTLDKVPIVVADQYGFAVNRFFVPWLTEATRLLEEGHGSIAFIDQIAEEVFQVNMGPFALMNASGLPIALHAAETLAGAFGPMYTPAEILRLQVATGDDWDCHSTACRNGGSNNENEVKSRLLAMPLGVAAQMVSEGGCSVTNTDLAARLGLRWPSGPFELINHYGLPYIKALVDKVFRKWDNKVPAIFADTDLNKGFAVEHVKLHVVGEAGVIELNRPDAMNALNENVIGQLIHCFDTLDANPAVNKIILFGRGKAFVAGADIKFFVDNIRNNDLERIYQFTLHGQSLLSRIEASEKKTIAYLDGMAFGGGLELALACDSRIATNKLIAAFPETGIGIYPGLGGTQRTTRLMGKGLSKYLVATGAFVHAQEALAFGLVDTVVPSLTDINDIADLDAVTPALSASQSQAQVFYGFTGEATDQAYIQYAKVLQKKAPLALKKSMQLIDQGAELDLPRALQLELDGLYEIFSTQDALNGLSSIIEGHKPVFIGE